MEVASSSGARRNRRPRSAAQLRLHRCTPVRVYGCGGGSLHTPFPDLRHAVGSCYRKVWRLGGTEHKAALNRRGGLEDCKDCQAEASKVQVNCCLKATKGRNDVGVKSNQGTWDERQASRLAGRRVERPARACSRVVHTSGRCGRPRLSLPGAAGDVLLRQVCRVE